MNEIQVKITQQAIDDEVSKCLQTNVLIDNQEQKVQIESNKRYEKLLQIEE